MDGEIRVDAQKIEAQELSEKEEAVFDPSIDSLVNRMIDDLVELQQLVGKQPVSPKEKEKIAKMVASGVKLLKNINPLAKASLVELKKGNAEKIKPRIIQTITNFSQQLKAEKHRLEPAAISKAVAPFAFVGAVDDGQKAQEAFDNGRHVAQDKGLKGVNQAKGLFLEALHLGFLESVHWLSEATLIEALGDDPNHYARLGLVKLYLDKLEAMVASLESKEGANLLFSARALWCVTNELLVPMRASELAKSALARVRVLEEKL